MIALLLLLDVELTIAGQTQTWPGGRGVVESQVLRLEAGGIMADLIPTAHRQFEKWKGAGTLHFQGVNYTFEDIEMKVDEVQETEFWATIRGSAVDASGRKHEVTGKLKGITCRLPVNKSKLIFIIIGCVAAAIPLVWLVSRLLKKG